MGSVILLAMLTQMGMAYPLATQSCLRETPASLQRLACDTDTGYRLDERVICHSLVVLWHFFAHNLICCSLQTTLIVFSALDEETEVPSS